MPSNARTTQQRRPQAEACGRPSGGELVRALYLVHVVLPGPTALGHHPNGQVSSRSRALIVRMHPHVPCPSRLSDSSMGPQVCSDPSALNLACPPGQWRQTLRRASTCSSVARSMPRVVLATLLAAWARRWVMCAAVLSFEVGGLGPRNAQRRRSISKSSSYSVYQPSSRFTVTAWPLISKKRVARATRCPTAPNETHATVDIPGQATEPTWPNASWARCSISHLYSAASASLRR